MIVARLLPDSMSTGLTASLACLGFTAVLWRYRPVHWVHTHSLTRTVHSWLWNYPLTPDFKIWDEGDPNQYEEWVKERGRTVHIWEFLAPYFAERGYKLYVRENLTDVFVSRYPASSKIDPLELSYPYAQYACKNERQLEVALVVSGMGNPQIFHAHLRYQSQRVWAARDREGRDVMLKLESSTVSAFVILSVSG